MIPHLFHGRPRVCRDSRVSPAMMDELKRPPLVEEGEKMMPRLMPSLLISMEEGECVSIYFDGADGQQDVWFGMDHGPGTH